MSLCSNISTFKLFKVTKQTPNYTEDKTLYIYAPRACYCNGFFVMVIWPDTCKATFLPFQFESLAKEEEELFQEMGVADLVSHQSDTWHSIDGQ